MLIRSVSRNRSSISTRSSAADQTVRPGRTLPSICSNAQRGTTALPGDWGRRLRHAGDQRVGAALCCWGARARSKGMFQIMKIAQIAPLYESCPPRFYGGTERVVAYITDELVRHGHEVTLFASGDSQTAARLEAGCEKALRLDGQVKDPLVYHLTMLDRVRRRADEFDILHFHTDYLHFPFFAECWDKTVTTLHGRLDLPDLAVMMRAFPDLPLVSISKAQRTPMPWANWYETILHGLPRDLHRFGEGNGGYLAFLGRVSPEKRVDRAIAIARQVGLPLQIAAKVDPVDSAYHETEIVPLLQDPLIQFVGEADKGPFLGDAVALLFPIDWPEPFGLVLIEAMANGTP